LRVVVRISDLTTESSTSSVAVDPQAGRGQSGRAGTIPAAKFSGQTKRRVYNLT